MVTDDQEITTQFVNAEAWVRVCKTHLDRLTGADEVAHKHLGDALTTLGKAAGRMREPSQSLEGLGAFTNAYNMSRAWARAEADRQAADSRLADARDALANARANLVRHFSA